MKSTGNKLQLAFIGGGVNSVVGSAHFAAINIDNEAEIVAGAFSRSEDINKASAEKYRVSRNRTYSSIEELIRQEKNSIDAVIILTPSDQHARHVISFLDAGIPVICEKSLSVSVEEGTNIKAVLEDNKGFLTVMYNYLGYPMIRELKNMISNGNLGVIKHIQIEMPQEGFARIDNNGQPVIPQNWRLKDNYIPTISFDLGVHLHMFINYLTNEKPLSVVAKSESLGNFSSIADNVNCIIEYTNNVFCNMWYSKIAIGNRNGLKLRIYGENASAEWVQEDPEILHIAINNGERKTIDRGSAIVNVCNKTKYNRFKVGHPAGFIEAYANYYNDIFTALREFIDTEQTVFTDCFGIEESLEGICLFNAIQKSEESKRWELLEKF